MKQKKNTLHVLSSLTPNQPQLKKLWSNPSQNFSFLITFFMTGKEQEMYIVKAITVPKIFLCQYQT